VLHNGNISHNDIRPYNVLYNGERGCYQLAGFGNAVKSGKGMKKSMNVSQIRGSMYYGAPELTKTLDTNL
jgi:serine/threonine protein kinase